MLPQFKPVLALVIIAGVAFGGETGFLVGAVTMMVSNVLFSQGPWMPWQMFSMGIIGFLAGILFRKGLLRRSRGSLATFGAFAAVHGINLWRRWDQTPRKRIVVLKPYILDSGGRRLDTLRRQKTKRT